MGKKKGNIAAGVAKALLILFGMLLPGIFLDVFYRLGVNYWGSWQAVSILRACKITYSSALKVLGGNVGVLVSIVSMFLTLNNNLSERFEKKIYGVPRAGLYENAGVFYRNTGKICLCAPALMLLFLNIEFCVSGYFVFGYCMLFMGMHYYRYDSSYSRPLEQMVCKIKDNLPKEGIWTWSMLSEYQILLECIGRSAEEEGNWAEIERLYFALLDATLEYSIDKRYLIAFYFYWIVFWKSEKKSKVVPLEMLRTYLDRLDVEVGKTGTIQESQWPVLWGMMRAAVCESGERELIRFLEHFYDFPRRGSDVLQKTEEYTLRQSAMEEQAGIMLILLEYRFRQMPPENVQFIDLSRKAWECGIRSFTFEKYRRTVGSDSSQNICFSQERYRCLSWVQIFVQSAFEEDKPGWEIVLENLMHDCDSDIKNSFIANINTIEIGR